eukprot:scaffold4503_cov167-Amphora_coffeaeformis.AAC.3
MSNLLSFPEQIERSSENKEKTRQAVADTLNLMGLDPRQRPLASKNNPSAELFAKVAGLEYSDEMFDLPLLSSKKKNIVGLFDRAMRLVNFGAELGITINGKTTKKALQKVFAVHCFPNDIPDDIKKSLKKVSPHSARRANLGKLFASEENTEDLMEPQELKESLESISGTDLMGILTEEQVEAVVAESARKRGIPHPDTELTSGPMDADSDSDSDGGALPLVGSLFGTPRRGDA